MATVKKNVIPPTPPKPIITYTVELSEAEAKALRGLLYAGVAHDALIKVGLEPLSEALEEAVVPFDTGVWRQIASI